MQFRKIQYSSFRDCLEWIVAEREGLYPTLVYIAYRFPMTLLSDRDLIFRMKRYQLTDKQVLFYIKTVVHP